MLSERWKQAVFPVKIAFRILEVSVMTIWKKQRLVNRVCAVLNVGMIDQIRGHFLPTDASGMLNSEPC